MMCDVLENALARAPAAAPLASKHNPLTLISIWGFVRCVHI